MQPKQKNNWELRSRYDRLGSQRVNNLWCFQKLIGNTSQARDNIGGGKHVCICGCQLTPWIQQGRKQAVGIATWRYLSGSWAAKWFATTPAPFGSIATWSGCTPCAGGWRPERWNLLQNPSVMITDVMLGENKNPDSGWDSKTFEFTFSVNIRRAVMFMELTLYLPKVRFIWVHMWHVRWKRFGCDQSRAELNLTSKAITNTNTNHYKHKHRKKHEQQMGNTEFVDNNPISEKLHDIWTRKAWVK